jgi:PAS domain S-box-containing protein
MDKKIKILLAEDNINDVKLLRGELRKDKLDFDLTVVDNEIGFRKAITEYKPDIILSDYSMPVFDGMSALKIKFEIAPLIPFIIVTGSLNEDTAVDCLKAGADDYVIKEHIHRIGNSVKSSLRTRDLNLEKEKTKNALIKSEAQLSNALNIARLGPWEYDVLNDTFIFNDLFYSIFRTTAEKVGGYKMSSSEYSKKFIHPDDSELVRIQVRKAIETTDPNFNQQLEHRIIYGDNGEVGYMTVRILLVKDENGRTIKTFGVNQDITDRKRIEEEIIQAKNKAEEMNRLKSSFLANMSHELRTPMVGILGFSEILANEIDIEELKNFAYSIHTSGKRLLNTLNLILDLSKFEAEKFDVVLINTNIIHVVKNIVSEYSIFAEIKKIYLKTEIKEVEMYSLLDERVFRSIIGNLLDNAIKYTNKGGVTIVIDKLVKDNKEYVEVKVKDTGIGIPEEYLNTIFEEFRQVSEGWSRSYEGTGLGLTIAKKYTDLLKGRIEVESKLNVGSTFSVILPLEKKPQSTEVEVSETNKKISKEYSGGKYNILLVDDDKNVFDLLSSFKEFDFSYANNEMQALKFLKECKFSLVLLDINLGSGINGLDILKKIRQIPVCREVPVIAVTAYAMIGDKDRFINAGCDDYISKPFDKMEFYELMEKFLIKN